MEIFDFDQSHTDNFPEQNYECELFGLFSWCFELTIIRRIFNKKSHCHDFTRLSKFHSLSDFGWFRCNLSGFRVFFAFFVVPLRFPLVTLFYALFKFRIFLHSPHCPTNCVNFVRQIWITQPMYSKFHLKFQILPV